eukprot:UN02760
MPLFGRVAVFSLFFGLICGQQCSPAQYAACGASVKQNGYGKTCDNNYACRDCIGCNSACPSPNCNPYPTCTDPEYKEAATYIVNKKDKLGWLNLCCESSAPASKRCLGCQRANIFNVLCGSVYPPYKYGLEAAGVQFAQNVPLNLPQSGQSGAVFDKTVYLFGVQYIAIGVIFGVLLVLTIINVWNCKNNKTYVRKVRNMHMDSEAAE